MIRNLIPKIYQFIYINYFKVDISDQIIFITNDNYISTQTNDNETIKAYAVMSVNFNTDLYFYFFYLPIVCLSWRLINYEPIIISVYSNSTPISKQAKKTIEYLNLYKIKIAYLKTESNYERTTGMLARLFVSLLNEDFVKNNDIIFQTDADLVPINKKYYHSFNKDPNSIKFFDIQNFALPMGTFRYSPEDKDYQMFLMMHIGMSKQKWFEIMKFNNESLFEGKMVLNLIKEYYGDSFVIKNKELKTGDEAWFLDQRILSINIAKYLKANKNSSMYINKSSGIKLDRYISDQKWLEIINTYKYDLLDFVHLYQGNFVEKLNISVLLFKKLFNQKQFISIEKYINEFLAIKNLK